MTETTPNGQRKYSCKQRTRKIQYGTFEDKVENTNANTYIYIQIQEDILGKVLRNRNCPLCKKGTKAIKYKLNK